MMCGIIGGLLKSLCVAGLSLTALGVTHGQAAGAQAPAASGETASNHVSPEEQARLRAAVEAHPEDMEAHRAYLKTFASANEAKAQYEQWMKQHPAVAAIPKALAEKYGSYSFERGPYLLKAAEIEPRNPEIWQELAVYASFQGDNVRQQEYFKKAAEAAPDDLALQFSYLRLLSEHDPALSARKILELAKKHPQSGASATALHLLGYDTRDPKEQIAIWKQLRSLSTDDKVHKVAMSRLADAYIQAGQYGNAIELSEAMIAHGAAPHLNFTQKLDVARRLAAIEEKMKEGRPSEAREMLEGVKTSKANLFDTGARVELVKASVLNATGATQAAYEGLLAFQARTPDPEARQALDSYGRALKKTKDQVRRELRALVARNSTPAPAFELDLYTSAGKVRLEDFKGKVLLLSFWYPGCGPCRGEMPHMEAGLKGIDRSKVAYLGVNGVRDQDAFVLPFMKGTGYSFTPVGATATTTRDYNVRAYPANLIIDQEGRIAYSRFMVNASNEKMLELMLRSLIEAD